jgi:hypothetical protein
MVITVTPYSPEAARYLANMRDGKGFGSEIMEELVADAGANVVKRWTDDIKTKANKPGWGNRYADSISIVRSSEFALKITAGGMFANLVESGVRRWDMKKSLKPGETRVIPFRHFTPTARQRSAMPAHIYEQVRKLRGGRLKGIPMSASEVAKGYLSSIFEGMKRYGKYGGRRGEYMTFRTMSFSLPEAEEARKKGIRQTPKWWYPEIPKSPVYKGVVSAVPSILRKTLTELVAKKIRDKMRGILSSVVEPTREGGGNG